MSVLSASARLLPDAIWETTIGEVCDFYGGEVQTGPFGSQLHASDYSEHGVPVVMPQDMVDGRVSCERIARVSAAHVNRLKRHVLEPGDIVFSRRGDVSKFAVITEAERGWLCGTGSIRIRLNCNQVDVDYLRRYLQLPSIGSWLLSEAKGITMANLNTQIIRSIPLCRPPLPEQLRIAAILDKANALRAKRGEAIAKRDQLLQSVFLDMFGDPVTNPKGWDVTSISESKCIVQTGPFGSLLHKSDYVPGGIPLINPMHIVDESIEPGDEQAISPEKAQELADYRLQVGDVIMGRRGEMGRCAVVTAAEAGMICGTGSLLIRPNSEAFLSRFLVKTLSSASMRRSLEGLSQGVTMPNLNSTTIEGLRVIKPPLSLQERFAGLLEEVEKQRSRIYKSEDQLSNLFASLQNRAFAG